MNENSIEAIEARAKAATPGPWSWWGHQEVHDIKLVTAHSGMLTVMAFRRWGMQDAEPEFQRDGLLIPAHEMPIYQVCPECESANDRRVYRKTVMGIRNPDAEFIAHSRADVDFLLERVRELEAAIAELQAVPA